jgi:transcription-repair coupling factor (superfamily II helicase)
MNWWLAKAKHIEEVEDVAKEFKYRFGALPQPVGNPLYMVGIRDSGYEG